MSRKLISFGTLLLLVVALASPLAQAAPYGPLTSIDPAPTLTPGPNPGPAPTATPGPNPGPAPTLTPGPAEFSKLTVQLHFQGRPDAPDYALALPVRFVLQLDGAYGVVGKATTDVKGRFSIDVSTFNPGTYNLWVKSPNNLANIVAVKLNGNADIQADAGMLLAGDANDDNAVNTFDYGILKNTFGKKSGEDGYDGRADFDGNKIVDQNDMDLLLSNFGKSGAKQPK